MTRRIHLANFMKALVTVVPVCLLIAACDREEDSHEDIVKADLLVIIESLGSPCGQVNSYESTEGLGYTVHCESGDQYEISVNPQGRIGIQNRE